MAPPMSPIHAGLANLSRAARGEGLIDIPEREEEKLDPLDDPTSPQSQSARRVFAGTKAGQRVVQSMGADWERTPARALPGGASLISLMAAESNDRDISPPKTPKAEPVGRRLALKQSEVGKRLEASQPGIIDSMGDDDLDALLRMEPKPPEAPKPLAERDNPTSAASRVAVQEWAKTPKGGQALADLDRPQKGKLYEPGEDPAPVIPSEQLSANAVEDLRKEIEPKPGKGSGAGGTGGGKTLPAEQVTALADVDVAKNAVTKLREKFDKLKMGTAFAKAGATMTNLFGLQGTDAADFQAAALEAMQTVGKILEGGKLAAGDEVKYRRLLIQPGDSPQVVRTKVEGLLSQLEDTRQYRLKAFGGAGYNVSGLQTKGDTPAPAAPAVGPKVGDTATNKKTGAKVRWDGSKWVPA